MHFASCSKPLNFKVQLKKDRTIPAVSIHRQGSPERLQTIPTSQDLPDQITDHSFDTDIANVITHAHLEGQARNRSLGIITNSKKPHEAQQDLCLPRALIILGQESNARPSTFAMGAQPTTRQPKSFQHRS